MSRDGLPHRAGPQATKTSITSFPPPPHNTYTLYGLPLLHKPLIKTQTATSGMQSSCALYMFQNKALISIDLICQISIQVTIHDRSKLQSYTVHVTCEERVDAPKGI